MRAITHTLSRSHRWHHQLPLSSRTPTHPATPAPSSHSPFKYLCPHGEQQCWTRETMDLTGAHTATIATLLLLLVPPLPLLLLCVPAGEANKSARTVREFYIAAVEIGWDYIYVDDVDPVSDQR